MFVLNHIEPINDDTSSLPEDCRHLLTFQLHFTLFDVPDTFTGTVFEHKSGELQLEHYNKPRGNRRKMFTLKNKLAPGSFNNIKACIFAFARGESIQYPQAFESRKPSSRTPGG